MYLPIGVLPVSKNIQSQGFKKQTNEWNLLKVDNEDTRTATGDADQLSYIVNFVKTYSSNV